MENHTKDIKKLKKDIEILKGSTQATDDILRILIKSNWRIRRKLNKKFKA